MQRSNVVREMRALDEDEFHAEFMVLLAKMNRLYSPAKVAAALGYTSKRQLANLANGGLPNLRGYYNLLTLDASAHEPIDRAYGQRKVPSGAICSTDPVSAKMAALLSRAIDAESPDSPGGQEVVLHEVIEMARTPNGEAMLRDVAAATAKWVSMLDDARKPALRSVGA